MIPRSAIRLLSLWLLVLVGAAPSSAVPVVVAVDTSRSLDAPALREVIDRLRLVLEDLDEETPAALLAFDDQPRWVLRPGATPAQVAEELERLTLQGSYTLLNDALFVATRELEDGGVLLLATDGRDENSAVEVEDIARRCEAQDVRIVSVGTGRNIEEKALRRLALVSDGAYLGPVTEAETAVVAEGLRTARDAVDEGRRENRSPRGQAPVDPRPAKTSPDPTDSTGGGEKVTSAETEIGGATPDEPWWSSPTVWALAVLGFALLIAVALLRRRSEAPGDDEEVQRALVSAEEQASDEAEAGLMRLELAQTESALPKEAPEVTVDTAVFERMTLDERLDRTRVLSNHSVLVMRKEGQRPRTFLLDRGKAFGIGRDPTKNTLTVPDPALSARHFKIVPRDDVYYFVDLESTNGSYVNGRRVGAKRLRHGDIIRAGQVEFEYQSYTNI